MVLEKSQKELQIKHERDRRETKHGQLMKVDPDSALDSEVSKSEPTPKKAKKPAQGNGNAKAASNVGKRDSLLPLQQHPPSSQFHRQPPTSSSIPYFPVLN